MTVTDSTVIALSHSQALNTSPNHIDALTFPLIAVVNMRIQPQRRSIDPLRPSGDFSTTSCRLRSAIGNLSLCEDINCDSPTYPDSQQTGTE